MDVFTYEINDFTGPLDLLLHLIEKNKIDIYDIPIASLTQQYLDFLETNNQKDMDTLSEFILMASTLISIKSKMLIPKKEENLQEEDPRADLVSSLLEYKKIKEVVEILKIDYDGKIFTKDIQNELEEIVSKREKIKTNDVLRDVTLQKLYYIFKDVIDRSEKIEKKVKKSFQYVKREQFKVTDKIAYICDVIKKREKISFLELFKNNSSKTEKVTTFLALLELIKSKNIIVQQECNFSNISIKLNKEQ